MIFRHQLKAYSLVEALITVAVLSIIVTLAAQSFLAINYNSIVVNDATVIQDKARTASKILISDLSKAGRGFQDLNQLDLWFDNGEGASPMLMINNLSVDANGFSDITIHYFEYDPTDNKNVTFFATHVNGNPFADQMTLYSENAYGELDQLGDNDIFIVYQYSGLASPSYYDGSYNESYWNIPNVLNSAVVLQLSPAGAPIQVSSDDSYTDYSIIMDYATSDGFLVSGASHWKEPDQSATMSRNPEDLIQTLLDNGGLKFRSTDVPQVVFARRIGSSDAFRSIRYFVNERNQLVRSEAQNDSVIIDNIETFKISLGLDTNIVESELVMSTDIDGSVSLNTAFDPNSRWLDDISSGDDAVLANRHAFAMRINLVIGSDVVDRARVKAGDSQHTKKTELETIIQLNNTLPRGDFSVRPSE